jgi:hypothetical protein
LESIPDWILVTHKMLGFATVLVVAPAALLVTIGGRAHRRLGLLYIVCMTVLYLSGTWFTFTKHELLGYKFLRNFSFNLFGYSFLLLAWRAVPLKRSDGGVVTRVDRAAWAGLVVLSLAMLPLGIKRWPMFVFGVVGLVFAWMDWQEMKDGVLSAKVRLNRHIRYMMASFYYVVTLLSILLMPGSFKAKWVWPSAVAGVVILLLTQPAVRDRFGWSRDGSARAALRFSTVLAFGLGALVLYQLSSSGLLFAQAGD